MEDTLRFDWNALSKLAPLCLEIAGKFKRKESIDIETTLQGIGESFGIEDIDRFAQDKIRNQLDQGLLTNIDPNAANILAQVLASAYIPIKSYLIEFAQGNKDSTDLFVGLNKICFGSTQQLEQVFCASFGIPNEQSAVLAEQFGPYLVLIFCFATAFKIYKKAAEDYSQEKERRIEIERLAQESISQLMIRQQEMQESLDDYLLDRLLPFKEGIAAMDAAILEDDDDRFISANAELWKAFGRKSQYSSADEFESLMNSDEVFRL